MSSIQAPAAASDPALRASWAARQLLLFGVLYLTAWTLGAAFISRAMHLDSIEQVVWAQSWQWGYYKHPPLPSALMHALNLAFGGPSQALTAFAAQGCSVIAMAYVWLLARCVMPPRIAIVAVVLDSLLSYHTINALTLNHNTVSLPFTAAALYHFYRAVRSGKRRHWIGLGVAAGLAMLTKYSAALALAGLLVVVVAERLWADRRVLRGLLLSLLVFALVLSPHVHWLFVNDFPTFHYAEHQLGSSVGRFHVLLGFLINQASRVSVMLLMAWVLAHWSDPAYIGTAPPANARERFDRRYLAITLCVPLVLAIAPALLRGDALDSNWVSAYFLPVGPLIAHGFFRGNHDPTLIPRTWKLTALAQIGIFVIFFAGAAVVPEIVGRNARFNFPSRELAATAQALWRAHARGPLRLVVSDTWTGGNIALHLRPEPMVFIDHDPHKSPWLSDRDVHDCGALVLVPQGKSADPAYAPLYREAMAQGQTQLDWGFGKRGIVVHYVWAVIEPADDGRLCRFKSELP
ncbi:MAG: glycosyltransferase family 39 protein [Proteobacteria bacterium]|nr:glycosyltransferase family 39 protein [Pseudomonadota bacterium]